MSSTTGRRQRTWNANPDKHDHYRHFWCPLCWAEDGGWSGAGILSVTGDDSTVEASQRHYRSVHAGLTEGLQALVVAAGCRVP